MYCTTLHCTTQHTLDTISNIISLIELHLSIYHTAVYCPLLVSITGTLTCQVPCYGPCNTGPISRPSGAVQARLSPTHLPPQARVCWSSRCPCCKTKKCHSTNPSLLTQGHKRGGHSVPALEQSDTLGRCLALGTKPPLPPPRPVPAPLVDETPVGRFSKVSFSPPRESTGCPIRTVAGSSILDPEGGHDSGVLRAGHPE